GDGKIHPESLVARPVRLRHAEETGGVSERNKYQPNKGKGPGALSLTQRQLLLVERLPVAAHAGQARNSGVEQLRSPPHVPQPAPEDLELWCAVVPGRLFWRGGEGDGANRTAAGVWPLLQWYAALQHDGLEVLAILARAAVERLSVAPLGFDEGHVE